ncbi:hypothetical protein GCM10027259_24180 [Micromonospora palomenae]
MPVASVSTVSNRVARPASADPSVAAPSIGLAEHFTLVGVPDDLPLEQAAIIPDAVSTPWGAIVATADVRPTQAVGVWGLGGLGAHAVQLLRLVGAAPIVAVDPIPDALARALALGADHALDPAPPTSTTRYAGSPAGAASTSPSTWPAPRRSGARPRPSSPTRAGWSWSDWHPNR